MPIFVEQGLTRPFQVLGRGNLDKTISRKTGRPEKQKVKAELTRFPSHLSLLCPLQLRRVELANQGVEVEKKGVKNQALFTAHTAEAHRKSSLISSPTRLASNSQSATPATSLRRLLPLKSLLELWSDSVREESVEERRSM